MVKMKLSRLSDLLDHLITKKDDLQKLCSLIEKHQDIIILGNGGSNAIASHLSQDYTKALGKRAISFSDPSRLTCYINDYGQDDAYKRFLQSFSSPTSLIILISSSGESRNILNCLDYCLAEDLSHIILTGFREDNTLKESSRDTAEINYWVDSADYGIVECLHQIFLHSAI